MIDCKRPEGWIVPSTGWICPVRYGAHPLKMTISEAREEVQKAWSSSYSAKRNRQALRRSGCTDPISDRDVGIRLFFRGIYFPQMSRWAWIKLVAQNGGSIFNLTGKPSASGIDRATDSARAGECGNINKRS